MGLPPVITGSTIFDLGTLIARDRPCNLPSKYSFRHGDPPLRRDRKDEENPGELWTSPVLAPGPNQRLVCPSVEVPDDLDVNWDGPDPGIWGGDDLVGAYFLRDAIESGLDSLEELSGERNVAPLIAVDGLFRTFTDEDETRGS